MAKYSRLEVINTIYDQGLMPLFYHHDISIAKKVLKACYDGGARLFEFTSRGDFAHEVFTELNKYALKSLPGMILGVGSVTDGATASLYLQLGANFIVTPVLREDIVTVCNRKKVLWCPGCGSLTEIAKAEELGCEIVKLFPGGNYGPGFVKAIKAPQPWTSVMPTGGVSPEEENLKAWFDAGVSCVGMGSKLIGKDMVENRQFKELEQKINKTLQLIQKVKLS